VTEAGKRRVAEKGVLMKENDVRSVYGIPAVCWDRFEGCSPLSQRLLKAIRRTSPKHAPRPFVELRLPLECFIRAFPLMVPFHETREG